MTMSPVTRLALLFSLAVVSVGCDGNPPSKGDSASGSPKAGGEFAYSLTTVRINPDKTSSRTVVPLSAQQAMDLGNGKMPVAAATDVKQVAAGVDVTKSASTVETTCHGTDLLIYDCGGPCCMPCNVLCIDTAGSFPVDLSQYYDAGKSTSWQNAAVTFWPGSTGGVFWTSDTYSPDQRYSCEPSDLTTLSQHWRYVYTAPSGCTY
jgi:hypothetical protein